MKIIVHNPQTVKEKILAGALLPVRPLLPDALIESWCRAAGHQWRERLWGPAVTFWACVWKQLNSGLSARELADWLAAFYSTPAELIAQDRDGSAFCQARLRLPEEVFLQAFRHVGAQAAERGGRWWRSLRVGIVDGSTMRTPRTMANQAGFGGPRNQWGPSGFPLVRVLLWVCAGSGAVLQAAVGPYWFSEVRLFVEQVRSWPSGWLIIGDTAFGSYLNVALLRQRGSHGLFPLSGSRRQACVRRLGQGDEIHLWRRPHLPTSAFPELLALLPTSFEMRRITWEIRRRGYRPWRLELCTTLLDPQLYPAVELVELYLQRWHIELDLRSLKSGMALTALSGKTPGVVRKEIWAGLTAWNLLRAVMAEAGVPRELSSERARVLLVNTTHQMMRAPTLLLPYLYRQMRALISSTRLEAQERLPEPRAIVARNRRYPELKISRLQWRVIYEVA